MKKILFILLFEITSTIMVSGQSFTIHDLLTVSKMKTTDINRFMSRNRFIVYRDNRGVDTTPISFIPKVKGWKKTDIPQRCVDVFQKGGSRYLILHTTRFDEFLEGEQALIKNKFIYDKTKNINTDSSILFQKDNISVVTNKELKDSITEYTFSLKQIKIPDSVIYAEDLLQFDSNEFLVSYFGEKNVQKDIYYFSENELRKCSVLFSNTPYQALFVWGDETNMDHLSYIIISNILPTKSNKESKISDAGNNWKLENGIHPGMSLRDVLRLNQMDFYIYGNKSDLPFMVEPEKTGVINFKKTGIMFRCIDCYDNEIFNQSEISALDIAKANLPLKVFDIVLYP